MSWFIFDECGERAQQLTLEQASGIVVRGWGVVTAPGAQLLKVLGFDPERTWRPTWFAVKMTAGYRVFEVDTGVLEYVEERKALEIWRPAGPEDKRLPSMAAVEMWIRHQVAREAAA